jgi:protein Mpv17
MRTKSWYGLLLEKIVKIQDPMLGLFARILLDAIIFSPVTVTGYFIWRSMLEGSGLRGASHKLRTRFSSTVLGAWKFWPAANTINFGMIPLEYRVLYSNVLSLFWTGYLTIVNDNSKRAIEDEKKKS